jgi:hypothetical protein
LEERVFSQPAVRAVLTRFVCVRLDGRESAENRALKQAYGPVTMGNVQNCLVAPSGENLTPLPIHFDTARLAHYLECWLALYPGVDEPPIEERPLPCFATLHQALNVAACDARVLVVLVDAPPAFESRFTPLAWHPEFAGRFHFVRAGSTDESLRRIHGTTSRREGAYLVIPDEFGMKGVVAAALAPQSTSNDVVDAARASLAIYAEQFQPRTVVEKFQRHLTCGERDWFYPPFQQPAEQKET